MPENPWEQRALQLQQTGDIAQTEQLEKDTPSQPAPPPPPSNPWEARAKQLSAQGAFGRFEPVRPEMQPSPGQQYARGLMTTMKPENMGLPPQSEWAKLEPKGVGATLADEWTGQNLVRKIPVAGVGGDIGEAAAGLIVMNRLKKDMEGKIPDGFTQGEWMLERNAHIQFLRGLQIKSDFAESQGYTFGGRVAQVVSQLPTLAAEFWLTGPLARGAQAGIGRLGVGVTGNIFKRAAIYGGVWGLQKIAGASIRTGTSLIGHAINNSLQRQLPEDVTVDNTGKVQFAGGEPAAVAWAKGFADTWIEALSEDLGADFAKLGRLGKVAALRKLSPTTRRAIKPFLQPLKELQKRWLKVNPGKKSNDFAKALFGGVGFDGTVEEMLEERAGDVLRSVTGVEDKTLAQSLFPGWEQLAVEATAFSVPGAMRTGAALTKSVLSKEAGAKDRAQALAAKAAESDDPKMKQFASKVESQLKAGELPEEGLLNRVIEAGEKLEQAEQGRVPEDTMATLLQEIEEAERLAEPTEFDPAATAPTLVIAEEVKPEAPVVEAPPEVKEAPVVEAKPKPAPKPKVDKRLLELGKPPAKVVVEEPAVPSEEEQVAELVREKEAELPEKGSSVYEGQVSIKGKDKGLSVIQSSKADVYQVRVEGEKPFTLEHGVAAQMMEADQRIPEIVRFMNEYKEAGGEDIIAKAMGIAEQIAPETWKYRGKKLVAALGIQPAKMTVKGALDPLDIQPLRPGSGTLPLHMVEPEFKRLRKLLTPGLAKQIMQDVTFWKGGLPLNVTPRKLEAFAERAQLKPKRAMLLGAVSKQMQDKELLEWTKAVLPARAHKMVASALERVIKSRTPGERGRVIDAVNRMIEKHDRAVALKKLRDEYEGLKKQRLLPEYEDTLDDVLAGVAMSKPSKKRVAEMAARMAQFEREQRAAEQADRPTFVPPKMIAQATDVLSRVGKVPITELSVDEMQRLRDAIKMLAFQNRYKQELRIRGQWRKAEDVEDESIEAIEARHGRKFSVEQGQLPKPEGLARSVKALELDLESLLTMSSNLMGDKALGHRVLYEEVIKGEKRAKEHIRRGSEAAVEAMRKLNISEKDLMSWSRDYQSLMRKAGNKVGLGDPPTVSITLPAQRGRHGEIKLEASKSALLSFFASMRDPDTAAKAVQKGFKVSFNNDFSGAFDLTREDVETIMQSPMVPKEVKALAAKLHEYVNTKEKEALNRSSREQTGFDKATREGYWPENVEFTRTDPDAMMREYERRLAENWGHYKPRRARKGKLRFSDGLRDFFSVVTHNAAYIGRNEPIKNALRLVGSKQFETAVKNAYGNKVGTAVLGKMRDRYRQLMGLGFEHQSGIDKLASKLMRNFTKGNLGLNEAVALYQALSVITMNAEVDMKHIIKGSALSAVNAAQTKEEIKEYSTMLYNRIRGGAVGIVTPGVTASGMWSFYGAGPGVSERIGMKPIKWMDMRTVLAGWNIAKSEMQEKGFKGEELLRKTAERTEEIFEKTQPTDDILTTANFIAESRQNIWKKMFVMFSSVITKNYNVTARALSDLKAGTISKRVAAQRIAVSMIIPSILVSLVKMGLDELWGAFSDGGDDDDGGDVLLAVMKRVLGQVLVFGDIANLTVSAVEHGIDKEQFWEKDQVGGPLGSTTKAFGTAMYELAWSMNESDIDKANRHWARSLDNWIKFAAYAGGIPIMRARRIRQLATREKKRRRKRR